MKMKLSKDKQKVLDNLRDNYDIALKEYVRAFKKGINGIDLMKIKDKSTEALDQLVNFLKEEVEKVKHASAIPSPA